MASSGNISTLNPLIKLPNALTYSNGNLKISSSGGFGTTQMIRSTHFIPKDKKIYIEMYINGGAGGDVGVGFGTRFSLANAGGVGGDGTVLVYYNLKYVNGSNSSFQTNASTGDIINLAIDGSNNKVWIGLNNTWGGSGDPANGSNEAGTINTSSSLGYDVSLICTLGTLGTVTFNFGQDSTFGGVISAGGNADGNGFGDFKYAPPTGFLTLCSANLSISDDIDPAQTDDDYPSKQFGIVTYTGNATTGQAITGLGLQPDLIWAKCRSHAQSNFLSDTSRGINKFVFSDQDSDEGTGGGYTTVYSSFDSDGFTLGTSGSGPNDSGRTYVAWGWRANGGTTASNSSGSITSTVQANTKGGFSIMTYTGNGSGGATIGHGLSAKPDFILIKRRSFDQTWGVYHSSLGATKYIALNTTAAAGTDSAFWNNTEPTTTLITLGTEGRVNYNTATYVAYAWHNVDGYSRFGKYVGNYNTDGTFIYTGFRPRMLFVKRSDAVNSWFVWDTERTTFNKMNSYLYWDLSNGEETGYAIDVYSNGFKLRGQNNATNNSGGTFIYGAWGDVPFKYNNTF